MKKENKTKMGKMIIMTIFVMLISFTLVNAAMYETLQSFEGRGCTLTQRASISSIIQTDLTNQFGLNVADDCELVLDVMPFSQETLDYTIFGNIRYAETKYIVDSGKEYLFILGKDTSALEAMAGLIANYEDYQNYLMEYDPDYPYFSMGIGSQIVLYEQFLTDYYDPTFTGPPNDQCVDNAIESVYLGNSGSYQDNGNVNFTSSCIDANNINYGFCFANVFLDVQSSCDCVSGKCIASFDDVLYNINSYGNYVGAGGKKIGVNDINAVVDSWLDN